MLPFTFVHHRSVLTPLSLALTLWLSSGGVAASSATQSAPSAAISAPANPVAAGTRPSSAKPAAPTRYPVMPGYLKLDLPDKGPRYPRPVQGGGSDLFQKALDAYRRKDVGFSSAAFGRLIKEFPESPYAEAAYAFRAEMALMRSTREQRNQEATNIYRTLLREVPKGLNAPRARWRLGDLYARRGFYVEAQSNYERGLADSSNAFDANRSLLGLGVLFMLAEQWKDAEQAFELVRQRTEDEQLLQHATVGLADALYAQNRLQEAQPFYSTSLLRWQPHLKMRPRSLLAFADTMMALRQERVARQVFTLFYNLYPDEPEAAGVLLRVGDSLRHAGQVQVASMFYARTITQHSDTTSGAIARMRLAEIGQVLLSRQPARRPPWIDEARVRNVHGPILEPERIEETFQSTARDHAATTLGSEALFHLGTHLEGKKDWSKAIRTYQQLIARTGSLPADPWPAKGAQQLAGILRPWILAALEADDHWGAITLFHRLGPAAVEAYPGTRLQLRLAHVHREMGFLQQAIALYQALIRYQDAHAFKEEALIGLGRTYLDQDDHSAGRRAFERYRIQYPMGRSTEEAMRFLTMALQQEGKPERVIRTARKWLARYRKHSARPEMLLLLARALGDSGQVGEAVRVYGQAAQAGGLTNVAAQIRYADLLVKGKRPRDAALWYRRALDSSTGPAEAEWARLGLATALFAQQQYKKSGQVLNELQLVAEDATVQRFTAAMLHELSRVEATQPANPKRHEDRT